MSELRERVAKIAYEAEKDSYGGHGWEYAKENLGNYTISDGGVPLYELDMAYEIADAAIAVITDALLSDSVVEAAARGMGDCMRMSGTTIYKSNHMPKPDELARAALQAAIAALTGESVAAAKKGAGDE